MDLDLSGRHALVCGASEGIGRACARELALLGATVTVMARRAGALHAVRDSLDTGRGQPHSLLVADSADTEPLRAAVAARAAASPVHILVNNTGGPPGGQAIDADIDAYLAAFRQHLLANQTITQTVVPGMREAGFGRIVNIVSTSVYEPIAGLGVSNTTRGAVAGWAKTLSRELGPDGITVNNVLPGFTETGRIAQIVRGQMDRTGEDEAGVRTRMAAAIPVGRFARPEETAALVAFLCSRSAACINGQSIAVDGGAMHSI